jgi:hypothetical protein
MAKIYFVDAPNFQPTHTANAYSVFLIGPILGTWEWQEYAKNRLEFLAQQDSSDLELVVFNPRQPQFKDLKDFDDDTFYQQVDWEHIHIARAGGKGVKLAWLANKTVDTKRNYCLTTLFELGEIIGEEGHKNVVVGIEPGFTNEKYLQYTIEKKAPEIELTGDLDEACDLTFQMLLRLKQEQ